MIEAVALGVGRAIERSENEIMESEIEIGIHPERLATHLCAL